MHQADWNMEIIAGVDLDRFYTGIDIIEPESSRHDVPVEMACSMMMPAGQGPNSDSGLAEQDTIRLESPLPNNPNCRITLLQPTTTNNLDARHNLLCRLTPYFRISLFQTLDKLG
jgi:hypothetical protein